MVGPYTGNYIEYKQNPTPDWELYDKLFHKARHYRASIKPSSSEDELDLRRPAHVILEEAWQEVWQEFAVRHDKRLTELQWSDPDLDNGNIQTIYASSDFILMGIMLLSNYQGHPLSYVIGVDGQVRVLFDWDSVETDYDFDMTREKPDCSRSYEHFIQRASVIDEPPIYIPMDQPQKRRRNDKTPAQVFSFLRWFINNFARVYDVVMDQDINGHLASDGNTHEYKYSGNTSIADVVSNRIKKPIDERIAEMSQTEHFGVFNEVIGFDIIMDELGHTPKVGETGKYFGDLPTAFSGADVEQFSNVGSRGLPSMGCSNTFSGASIQYQHTSRNKAMITIIPPRMGTVSKELLEKLPAEMRQPVYKLSSDNIPYAYRKVHVLIALLNAYKVDKRDKTVTAILRAMNVLKRDNKDRTLYSLPLVSDMDSTHKMGVDLPYDLDSPQAIWDSMIHGTSDLMPVMYDILCDHTKKLGPRHPDSVMHDYGYHWETMMVNPHTGDIRGEIMTFYGIISSLARKMVEEKLPKDTNEFTELQAVQIMEQFYHLDDDSFLFEDKGGRKLAQPFFNKYGKALTIRAMLKLMNAYVRLYSSRLVGSGEHARGMLAEVDAVMERRSREMSVTIHKEMSEEALRKDSENPDMEFALAQIAQQAKETETSNLTASYDWRDHKMVKPSIAGSEPSALARTYNRPDERPADPLYRRMLEVYRKAPLSIEVLVMLIAEQEAKAELQNMYEGVLTMEVGMKEKLVYEISSASHKAVANAVSSLDGLGHKVVYSSINRFFIIIQKSESSFINKWTKDKNLSLMLLGKDADNVLPDFEQTPCGKLHTEPRKHAGACSACKQLAKNLIKAEESAKAKAEAEAIQAEEDRQRRIRAGLEQPMTGEMSGTPSGSQNSGSYDGDMRSSWPNNPIVNHNGNMIKKQTEKTMKATAVKSFKTIENDTLSAEPNPEDKLTELEGRRDQLAEYRNQIELDWDKAKADALKGVDAEIAKYQQICEILQDRILKASEESEEIKQAKQYLQEVIDKQAEQTKMQDDTLRELLAQI